MIGPGEIFAPFFVLMWIFVPVFILIGAAAVLRTIGIIGSQSSRREIQALRAEVEQLRKEFQLQRSSAPEEISRLRKELDQMRGDYNERFLQIDREIRRLQKRLIQSQEETLLEGGVSGEKPLSRELRERE